MANHQFSRRNTFIVDFSAAPRQVRDMEIVTFMETKLKIVQEHVLSLQPKRNYIYVECPSLDIAQGYVDSHERKHVIRIDDHDYAVRLVMEDGGVNVKVRDLPPQWDNDVIVDELKRYGKVICAKDDTWDIGLLKGVRNGTRTIRMIIHKPIPSYLRIFNELAFISYPNQQHTCKSCHKPIHPYQKCSEVVQRKTNLAQRLEMSGDDEGQDEGEYQDDYQEEKDDDTLENQLPSLQLPPLRPSPYAAALISGRSSVNLNLLNETHRDAARKRGPEDERDMLTSRFVAGQSKDHRTLLDVVRNQPIEKSSRREENPTENPDDIEM